MRLRVIFEREKTTSLNFFQKQNCTFQLYPGWDRGSVFTSFAETSLVWNESLTEYEVRQSSHSIEDLPQQVNNYERGRLLRNSSDRSLVVFYEHSSRTESRVVNPRTWVLETLESENLEVNILSLFSFSQIFETLAF